MSAIHSQSHRLLLALLLQGIIAHSASATCFYRDGSIASSDIPCPNSSICCPSGDTCMENGLCRDVNNHPSGSLTIFSDGHKYNYTGLYYTSSCQDRGFQNCLTQCTTSLSSTGDYIWACNDALTSFCCHNSVDSLGQFDCCTSSTLFSLPSPKVLTNQPASSSPAPLSTATSTTSSSSSSISSSSTTTSPAPTNTTSSPSSSKQRSSQSSTLSTGAKAGIGVGVGLAGIIIIVLIALLYRANRKLQQRKADGDEGGDTGAEKIEQNENGSESELARSELAGRQILARQRIPQEVAGQPRSELEASTQGGGGSSAEQEQEQEQPGTQRFELEC